MHDVVIVDAVRSPFGKRHHAYAGVHSVDLLGQVIVALLKRNGLTGQEVDQVIGGCVTQIGMQASNVTRWAWLTAGLPVEVGACTVDAQCGSSQHTVALGQALIASGQASIVICCGVESMTGVPMGSQVPEDGSLGRPVTDAYTTRYEYTSQFESADRIAAKWGLTRQDCDAYAVQSQSRAAAAQASGAFDEQLIGIEVARGRGTEVVGTDECPRPTTLEGLADLQPVNAGGVHTAGTSSQMSDGAAAVLLMSRPTAVHMGLQPLATIVDGCLVGSDPVLKLTGPISATARLLQRNHLTVADFSVVEINEAFASVALAWLREFGPDDEKVNPNGGAIALGHPLGATGCALITKATHELVRRDEVYALVAICCGGGMATATVLRRG
ncbi:thiolase family protein [Mycolicibacterium elephantis]